MSIKVVKFGGSSLASAEQFRKVAEIIKADKSRKYVVASAPGKRFTGDFKVTDMFYLLYDKASKGENIDELYGEICFRYTDIAKTLGVDIPLEKELSKIKDALYNMAGRDYAASRGEYLNSMILASHMGYDFIDAAEVIFFKQDGTFDSETTNKILSERLKKHEYAVVPGFYGSMPNGTIKTFSRGGSDITGSILARAANASLYENWTDVSGFLMTDPRVVEKPKVIEIITYRELRELSYMGATVLHEDAIFPVQIAGIPINIKNTNAPEDPGTMIVAHSDKYDTKNIITGIAGKKGFSAIHIEKDMMNGEVGFTRKILSVLEEKNISFEHLPSGIDTMTIMLKTADIESVREQLISDITKAVHPDNIYIQDGIALVAVVGRAMVKAKGTAAKIFRAIANADINIKMIDQGSDEMNIIIGIEEVDFEKALNAIYKEFIN